MTSWFTLRTLLESTTLRDRFMAIAADDADPDALWDRMEASMDEDEIEAYVEDMESRGHRTIRHDDSWESRSAVIRRALDSGESLSLSRGRDLADAPRSLALTPELAGILRRSAEWALAMVRRKAEHPMSDEDDGMLAALDQAAAGLLNSGKLADTRDRVELEPVEVYALHLGATHVEQEGGPGFIGTSEWDGVTDSLVELLDDLTEHDAGRDDRRLRAFLRVYGEYLRRHPPRRGRTWHGFV